MRLSPCAGERWAEIGIVADVHEPLNMFAQNRFSWFIEIPWLVAAAGFGWAAIRPGVPSWVDYLAIGWSVPGCSSRPCSVQACSPFDETGTKPTSA